MSTSDTDTILKRPQTSIRREVRSPRCITDRYPDKGSNRSKALPYHATIDDSCTSWPEECRCQRARGSTVESDPLCCTINNRASNTSPYNCSISGSCSIRIGEYRCRNAC